MNSETVRLVENVLNQQLYQKWLWEIDSKGSFSINRARKEFEGVVSQARNINKKYKIIHNKPKKACDSCNPLLKHFNIIEVFN